MKSSILQKKWLLFLTGILAITLMDAPVFSQQLAFPGAEGFGRFTTGGRGGRVIEVTNLNDGGTGSLRDAINQSGARTVVFRVSGTIVLNSVLTIRNGNITIAGQTAPGDGICIRDYTLTVSADNVIIRYLRARLGDAREQENDAMNGRNNENIIIDHCSMSWSVDETASFYDNENFTMQWCIISESLYKSQHAKGNHGYGGIWGGKGASFHHNLIAHHTSRNPRFCGSRYSARPDLERIDHRNNVIYNWGGNSSYGAEGGSYNIVNNYYKSGPATGSTANRIIHPDSDNGGNSQPAGVTGVFYVDGNYVAGYPEISENNWNGGVQGINAGDDIRSYDPFEMEPVLTHKAEHAYIEVLADAGATLPKRDPIDSRIVMETETGTATYGASYGSGSGIIDTPGDVGGWPELTSTEAPADGDHDGMPDAWEDANGLDKTNPDDRNGDANGDGYTNLENYLNSIVRTDFLLRPGQLQANAISATEIQLKWVEHTQGETGFSIERAGSENGTFVEIGVANPNDTSFVDSGLNDATTYYYRVRAIGDGVQSNLSGAAIARTFYADGRPLEATEFSPAQSVEAVPVEAILSWNEGLGAVSYDVYFGTENPPPFMENVTETSYDPRGLADSTIYFWRVDAVNAAGASPSEVLQFTSENYPEILVSYWQVDRGFGAIVLDKAGSRNHASFNNMSGDNWIAGVSEDAILFTGDQQFLKTPYSASVDPHIRSFSLAFWLRQDNPTRFTPWISKIAENGAGFEIFHHDDEYVEFFVSDGETTTQLQVDNGPFVSGEWVFVTAIRDTEMDELRLYVNGEMVGSTSDNAWNIAGNGDLYFGSNAAELQFHQGGLDEMRLYSYALSEQEIQELYTSITAVAEQPHPVKFQFASANYPNPFNPETQIVFTLAEPSKVTLSVFNILGQEVAKLIENKPFAVGKFNVNFDAKHLQSGVYFYRLRAGNNVINRKMLLLE